MLRQVREGLTYVWQHRPSFYLMLLVAINSGFGMQYTVLIPMFARDLLHSGAEGYGFLMAAQGIGAVAGAIVMNSRSDDAAGAAPEPGVRAVLHRVRDLRVRNFPWMWLSLIAQMFIGAGLDESHGDDQHDAATVRRPTSCAAAS